MLKECLWKPDFEKWYHVNKDAYKFIFTQAEKKLEDVLSESESITNKSIKLITATVSMFAFFIGFILQKNILIGYNVIMVIFFISNVVCIIFLIFPKEVKGRGFVPSELLPKRLDHPDDKEYQEEMLYYCAIVKLEEDIKTMRQKNKARSKIYLINLILSLILLVSGVTYIIASL